MNKIGIFFGTDSGTTRLIAKKIQKKLGSDIADKPLNINRIELNDIMQYDAIILGTPTYGAGELPGRATGMQSDSWSEILPVLGFEKFVGKTIALYGLGDQEKYHQTFANGMGKIYSLLTSKGATIVGQWPTESYKYTASESVINDQFVGLVIDQSNQSLLTEQRIDTWLEQIKPQLLAACGQTSEVVNS